VASNVPKFLGVQDNNGNLAGSYWHPHLAWLILHIPAPYLKEQAYSPGANEGFPELKSNMNMRAAFQRENQKKMHAGSLLVQDERSAQHLGRMMLRMTTENSASWRGRGVRFELYLLMTSGHWCQIRQAACCSDSYLEAEAGWSAAVLNAVNLQIILIGKYLFIHPFFALPRFQITQLCGAGV